jgi:hypothetical protein
VAGIDGVSCSVLPFCDCFLEGEGREVQKTIGPFLGWRVGEYDVLSTLETYAVIARHRRECRLQPDLLEASVASRSARPRARRPIERIDL